MGLQFLPPSSRGALLISGHFLSVWLGNFGSTGGLALQGCSKIQGGTEDFDESCNNVITKTLKIEQTFYPIFPFCVSQLLSWQRWLQLVCIHTKGRFAADLETNLCTEFAKYFNKSGQVGYFFFYRRGAGCLGSCWENLVVQGGLSLQREAQKSSGSETLLETIWGNSHFVGYF